MKINEYITKKSLSTQKQAEIFEKTGEGYFYTHQDAMACVFHNGEPISYIGYVEFSPNKSRGSHYHLKKNEILCVVKGTIKAKFRIEDTGEELEMTLNTGDIITVKAGCSHSYLSEDFAAIIEYSKEKFERSDTYHVDFDWE